MPIGGNVSATAPSGYENGKTIQEVATEWGQTLVKEAMSDQLNSESAYGITTYVVADVTIAGGGPGAHIQFSFEPEARAETLYDYSPIEATLHYYEWDGRAKYEFTQDEAEALWDRLTTPPEAA